MKGAEVAQDHGIRLTTAGGRPKSVYEDYTRQQASRT